MLGHRQEQINKNRFVFIPKNKYQRMILKPQDTENKSEESRKLKLEKSTVSRDPKLGEELRALHLVLVYFHVPRYGCSGNGPEDCLYSSREISFSWHFDIQSQSINSNNS